MITIVRMIDLGTEPSSEQVWIVPGPASDFDDGGDYSGWYIADYLRERGICVGRGLDSGETEELIESIKAKFQKAGMDVVVEVTCND